MEKRDLILVALPWPSLNRTPIQLGILKPVVERAGFSVGTRSFFLSAIEYFAACTEHLPTEDRVSIGDYNTIIHRWKLGMGDWIFAVPPYKAYDPAMDRDYFSFLRDKNVMRMALLHRGRAHRDEAALGAQFFDIPCSAITHAGAEPTD